MPPAAPAPIVVVDREPAFAAELLAIAQLAVPVLDEKQPERDWRRWLHAIEEALVGVCCTLHVVLHR